MSVSINTSGNTVVIGASSNPVAVVQSVSVTNVKFDDAGLQGPVGPQGPSFVIYTLPLAP